MLYSNNLNMLKAKFENHRIKELYIQVILSLESVMKLLISLRRDV